MPDIQDTGPRPVIADTEARIVVVGDPVEGFSFHGPFASTDTAVEWADAECDADWWVAPLNIAGEK